MLRRSSLVVISSLTISTTASQIGKQRRRPFRKSLGCLRTALHTRQHRQRQTKRQWVTAKILAWKMRLTQIVKLASLEFQFLATVQDILTPLVAKKRCAEAIFMSGGGTEQVCV